MEKNLCFNRERQEMYPFRKIFLIMRLMMFLIMATLGQLIASQTYSQTARLNFNLKNATVEDVLNRIEESTDFYFLYNKRIIDVERKVDINAENNAINEVLDLLFKGSKVTYTIVDRQIVLSDNNVVQQQKKVTGKVTDSSAQPLPGVTIFVKGTANGTTSNVDGNYSLENVPAKATLVFSFIGMETLELEVGAESIINVKLVEETLAIKEVIVTALGIKRENKALGYSVEQKDGAEITQAREANFVNSLAGRVAGVNITHGANGSGSSSRIVIRGETSLNGTNQPLFVVDGIPIRNNTDNRSSGLNKNMNVDFGNGAAEINPEDIETISILKGASAAALYGSRAGNGVILITTKSGKNKKGLGVSFNSTTTFETILAAPDYQEEYGQGKNMQFSFLDGYGSGLYDGVDESWGPKLDGSLIAQFDSPTSTGLRGGDVHGIGHILGKSGLDLVRRGTITPTPWVNHGSVIDQYFRTGITTTNSVAFSGSNDQADFRLSLTNFDNEDIMPNTGLKRNTISFNSTYRLSDKLNVKASASYINSYSNNRAVNGYGTESVMFLWTWWGQQIDMKSLKNYWQKGNEGYQQFNYNYNYHDNPYFNAYENTNGLDKNHLIGNVSINYQITNELSLMLRTGLDYYNELRTWKRAFSTQRFPNGQYREDNVIFREMNSDFLLTYSKGFGSDVKFSGSLGGSVMNQKDHYSALSAEKLVIPGIYNFSNSNVPLLSNMSRYEKEIRSIYGMAQASYKDKLYMDITARNDWSSTLPVNKNSYFYPSISFSAIISEMVDLPKAVSYAKLRLGIAQVGNDTNPYNLFDTYTFDTPWGDNLIAKESRSVANANLKPEISTTYEIGTELKFFNNRLGIDVTYYYGLNKNQILATQLPYSSGYSKMWINAGEISNKGIEAMLSGDVLKNNGGLNWTSSINYSSNRAYVEELAPGIDSYSITGNRVSIIAKVGERMGTMYGTGVTKNPVDGRPIYNKGLTTKDGTLKKLGNYNPDFRIGFLNDFRYKNVSFSFLFDWSYGGSLVSATRLIAATAGEMVETLWGRDPEHGGPKPGIKDGGLSWTDKGVNYTDGVIGDGWKSDGSGGYVENDVIVHASAYHNARYPRDNEEEGLYDASYVKLREMKIGYQLPQKILTKTFIENIKISAVGRNLALWTKFPHGDPETFAMSGNYLIPGVEDFSLPATRSIGFNLDITF